MTHTLTLIIAAALLSALIIGTFYLLNKKINMLLKKPAQEKQPTENQQLMTLKLQAYERIILYIERIELEGLVMRTFFPEMTVQQLQSALLRAIREEFEHNSTQQLYITEQAWEYTKGARALILSIITQACKELAPTDNGMLLAQTLFTCVQDKETYTFAHFPLMIKREMEREM